MQSCFRMMMSSDGHLLGSCSLATGLAGLSVQSVNRGLGSRRLLQRSLQALCARLEVCL